MRSITLTRTLDAPQSAVWAVLADYPNISAWNDGVKKSYSTGEATEGVGAKRHCDLAPFGGLEETIQEWEPESRLKISIDEASKLPLKKGMATFDLSAAGDKTDFVMTYEYQPGFGPVGALMGPILDKQFEKGFGGFIDDLTKAAQAQPAA